MYRRTPTERHGVQLMYGKSSESLCDRVVRIVYLDVVADCRGGRKERQGGRGVFVPC